MPELPQQPDIMVLDVIENDKGILISGVRCVLCHGVGQMSDHVIEPDGTLRCVDCGITIAAHETVERPSILKVNLPRTWQVSNVP